MNIIYNMRIGQFLPLFLTASLIASEQPSIQASKQVSDILSKREEVVRNADLKAVKELKTLMTKYKKEKATSILIAIKLHKLSADDADAVAILKDVPAADQDLLGDVGEPGKYLTDIQAKMIADALTKGKFSSRDWEALPGKVVEVKPIAGMQPLTKNESQPKTWIVVPNPDDQWRTRPEVGYKKWDNILMAAFNERLETIDLAVGKIIKVAAGSTLNVCEDGAQPKAPLGMIRVKIFEVVPVE